MSQQEQEKKKSILISMYNFKGGVGKTTGVYCLGYTLASIGARVLMVDLDAQCSLTSSIFAKEISDYDKNHSDKKDPLTELYDKAKIAKEEDKGLLTINEILVPLVNVQPRDLSDAKKVKITQVKNYKNLFLIPGHMDVARLDEPITLTLNGIILYKNYPGYIMNLMREIGSLNNIDIILFDLNPSSGYFNQTIIMGSDYFMIPFFPDGFSNQAIKSLTQQLPTWYEKFANLNKSVTEPFGMLKNVPKFLCAYPQKIRVKGGKVEQAYESWVSKIYNEIEKFGETLKTKGLVSDKYMFYKHFGIQDFVSAGLDVQTSGAPMTDVEFPHKHVDGNGNEKSFSQDSKSRKKHSYDSYKKIISNSFNLFNTEDYECLNPILKQNLIYYSELKLDFKALYASPPKTPKTEKKDESRFYEDTDVDTLIKEYTAGYNCVVYDSIAGISDYLEPRLKEISKSIKEENEYPYFILLPINVSTYGKTNYESLNHWVILSFKVNNSNSYEILYYDPLNGGIPNNVKSLITHFFEDDEIHSQTAGVDQEDDYNCGPWIVEYARSLAQGTNRPNPGTNEILIKRKEHEKLLKEKTKLEKKTEKRKEKDDLGKNLKKKKSDE